MKKCFFALFQADRVDDRLALHAFQARFDDRPLRAVDHDRHAGNLRLGGQQIQKLRHHRFAVEQGFVEVHVEHIRAALDLLPGHAQSGFEVAVFNEPGEFLRAGDIGPLADHREIRFRPNRERFQPAQPRERFHLRPLSRSDIFHRLGNRFDMRRRGAATAADDIDPAVLGKLAQQPGHRLRRFVEAA